MYPTVRSSRHYADQPALPTQLKMIHLPVAVRIAALVLLGIAVPLRAEPTTAIASPAKPSPEPAAPPATAPAPGQIAEIPELALVSQFDTNGDHRLDAAERRTALAYLEGHPPAEPPVQTGRHSPPPPPTAALEPTKRGLTVTPDSVDPLAGEELFGTSKVRTFFLTFTEADWEAQLAGFARTDVQVPARLEVSGKTLAGVGVHFRAPLPGDAFTAGYKRSLRLKLDYTEAGQELSGHHRLELQASATDPTLLRTLLYQRVRQEYLPGPAGSLVRLVINGEDWGIYTCLEPFDAAFVRQKLGPKVTMFWTAGPGANLEYLGDDPDAYRSRYHLESPEDPAAWAKLIQLCKTLRQPLDDNTGYALAEIIDADSTTRFLALQNAFVNQDGYGSTTGSYGLYVGGDGRFRLVPLEAERSFRLIQVTEYDPPAHRRGPRAGGRHAGKRATPPAGNATNAADREAALLQPYLHPEFPKQSGTNLATLLSHSLIAKADGNGNDKVSAEEWHAFARSWFVIMDEDITGSLTRDQFIAKVRLLVTPPSVIDGHTMQTFGHDDAAAMIAGDFLKVIETDHDGHVSSDEMVAGLDQLFAKWAEGKPAVLTQPILQKGLSAFLSKSVFLADQTYIPTATAQPVVEGNKPKGKSGGHGGSGGGKSAATGGNSAPSGTNVPSGTQVAATDGSSGSGASGGSNSVAPSAGSGGGSNSGLNLGPVHLGLPKSPSSRLDYSPPTFTTFGEQLEPLEGKHDDTKPLIAKMLAIPGWQTRYRNYLSQITDDWLLWTKLGPIAKAWHDSIAAVVREETHKPFSYERFVQELDQYATQDAGEYEDNPSLKSFVTGRRTYLLKNGTGAGGD